MENKLFNLKQFVIITLITSTWIHIGETVRAMFLAFPLMESFFEGKLQLVDAEQMQFSHALVWGLWDTILTAVLVFIFFLCSVAFGNNRKSVLISGTITAFATIGIFWIALANSGLGEWSSAYKIFPFAWLELVIGAQIASRLYKG